MQKRRQRGVALVEFTLVLLPMMALLMLTIDAAWAIFAKATLQEAAREGVRFGITCSQNGLDTAIKQTVQHYSMGFISPGAVTNSSSTTIQLHYFEQVTDSKGNMTIADVPGQPGAVAGGNILQVTVSAVSVRPFAPIWRSSTPLSLGAISADVMEASQSGACSE